MSSRQGPLRSLLEVQDNQPQTGLLAQPGLTRFQPPPGPVTPSGAPQPEVAPPPTPAPSGPRGLEPPVGLGTRIAEMLGGSPRPDLSPEENEALKRRAFMTAGLAMLADPDGGMGAIGRGILAGREDTEAYGRKLEEENEVRLAKLQQQQQMAQQLELLSNWSIVDENSRMMAVEDSMRRGDLASAEFLMKAEPMLRDMDSYQRQRFVERDLDRRIEEGGVDTTTPEGLLFAAGLYTRQGITDVAAKYQDMAETIQRIEQAHEGLTWQDLGDRRVAVDRYGNEVASLDKEMTPGEQAADLRAREQQALARQQGATGETLSAMRNITNDFRTAASEAQDVAHFANLAQEAALGRLGTDVLVNAFLKILDSDSAVMDGEFGRVFSAARPGGPSGWISGAMSRLRAGTLPEEDQERLRDTIIDMAMQGRQLFEETILPRYVIQAQVAGLDPNVVLWNPFQTNMDLNTVQLPTVEGVPSALGGGTAPSVGGGAGPNIGADNPLGRYYQ